MSTKYHINKITFKYRCGKGKENSQAINVLNKLIPNFIFLSCVLFFAQVKLELGGLCLIQLVCTPTQHPSLFS